MIKKKIAVYSDKQSWLTFYRVKKLFSLDVSINLENSAAAYSTMSVALIIVYSIFNAIHLHD